MPSLSCQVLAAQSNDIETPVLSELAVCVMYVCVYVGDFLKQAANSMFKAVKDYLNNCTPVVLFI